MKTLRACFAAGLIVLGAVGGLRADDNLRRYQQSLHEQGFYYGPIDGSPGDETTQSLRRYQIRNGLAVTGQLDDETRRSIDKAAAEAAQSTPGPLTTPPPETPAPVRRPAPTPVPRAEDPADRRDQRSAPPPPDTQPDGLKRIAPSSTLTNYFGGTPFEFAPPPVQSDTVLRAQKLLTRYGFYDGAVDGRPNRDLADAVSNFQEVNRLRRTGRLDTNTLAAMRLLPDRRSGPPRRNDSDDRRDRGGVYEGRVVD